MRMKMVGPRYIDPLTAILQKLYAPPVLLVVLLLAAVAHGWLFFVHGVAGGFHDVLYSPRAAAGRPRCHRPLDRFPRVRPRRGLALRRRQVRGMGMGIYLVYPVFYTDVTDNYRLGRWARVRTDLGGFYFNLIFGTGLIALYLATGLDFLLLVVVFIVLEIVHQTLPFVRLDGYWALADLTGMPDFFSQIGPIPADCPAAPLLEGPQTPAGQAGVKVVFGLYILITIPLLAFLLFMMVRSFPRVLATGWDSFGQQWDSSETAQAAGDIVGMASAGAQALLLLLPTFGMIFIVTKLFKGLFTRIWAWSKPSAGRQVIGALATGGVVALLAFLWLPAIPFSGGEAGPLYARANFTPIQPVERGTVCRFRRPDSWRPGPVKPIRQQPGSASSRNRHANRHADDRDRHGHDDRHRDDDRYHNGHDDRHDDGHDNRHADRHADSDINATSSPDQPAARHRANRATRARTTGADRRTGPGTDLPRADQHDNRRRDD